jgi:hypothetical protein
MSDGDVGIKDKKVSKSEKKWTCLPYKMGTRAAISIFESYVVRCGTELRL